jgi:RNA polymerase sigma-70 factor (ECF subfamily)
MCLEGTSMDPDAAGATRVERFRVTYEENYVQILGYALRRTPTEEDAADVVAETFLTLWRRLDDAPTGDETRLWLYGIARRVISNRQRGERRRARLRARVTAMMPLHTANGTATPDVVSEAMAALAPQDREVLRLSAWEELSPGEIAVALGCSTNAAKIRLHRARRRLAFRLNAAGVGRSGMRGPDVTFGT